VDGPSNKKYNEPSAGPDRPGGENDR
jgi:hypothetical protein